MSDQMWIRQVQPDAPGPHRPDTQSVTVSIDKLVFQVLFLTGNERVTLQVPSDYRSHLMPIWPHALLDDDWLELLTNARLTTAHRPAPPPGS
jgi:hypothetical protein